MNLVTTIAPEAPGAALAKPSLAGLGREGLKGALAAVGVPPKQLNMRAGQLWSWIYARGATSFDVMSDVAKDLRGKLAAAYSLDRPEIVQEQVSTDGTRKWLLRLPKRGHEVRPPEIETVYIPEADRGTLCISSQVGCTLTCSFCHTGTQRLVRNLLPEEIVGQILLARDRIGDWPGASAPGDGGLLPEAEPEISEALTGYLRDEGITVRTGLTYRGIARTAAGVELSITTDGAQQVIAAEQVLVATGRAPNTDGLGLVEAGIAQADNGSVVVDDRMRTSRPDVYAAGDVTGRDQFVYMAAYGAKLAAHNALNGDDLVYDNTVMPWVTFTDPQVAGVGLSERAAQAAGFETKTSIVALDQVPRALAARDTRGLIKLVADKTSDRLLGGQIVAPEGADSIQTMVLALRHRMTAQALAETIFPYLTAVEGLKLAALGFMKDVAKLSCCAG